MTELERRVVDKPTEFRAAAEGSGGVGVLTGYAVVFDSPSRDLGGWFEEIAPEAFGAPDAEGRVDMALHTRVIARAEHDSRLLLGTTDAGTLRLYIDDVGVRYEVDLPDTGAGRDVAALAKRGDYRHSSFAFHALEVEWRENVAGSLVRRVIRSVLSDVAPVADPAYWAATTQMRSAVDIDAVRASLHPSPAGPGEWEAEASKRAAAMTRETHPALANRARKRGI
ncbi:HK97 family phage prohead protease [Microbacterium testaceum]|uniref:HK97 family phage prohead protease n=1 Tax=Microbacterium TaxID=33882 RepID=UPI0027860F62|nr:MULTISPECIES: HK97 family phage prohead protease [Microbacterium]MDQ1111170.1 HK97 family phage prohead protease [Microbacterium testaceum]MDR6098291.1 HK97 family phage prohead protease [Microbacterium sp. SORGH_AS_0454]